MTPRMLWILPVVGPNGEAAFYLPRVLEMPEKSVCQFVTRWMAPDAPMRVESAPFFLPVTRRYWNRGKF